MGPVSGRMQSCCCTRQAFPRGVCGFVISARIALLSVMLFEYSVVLDMCPVAESANSKERLQTGHEAGRHRPATSIHVFRPNCG